MILFRANCIIYQEYYYYNAVAPQTTSIHKVLICIIH